MWTDVLVLVLQLVATLFIVYMFYFLLKQQLKACEMEAVFREYCTTVDEKLAKLNSVIEELEQFIEENPNG